MQREAMSCLTRTSMADEDSRNNLCYFESMTSVVDKNVFEFTEEPVRGTRRQYILG